MECRKRWESCVSDSTHVSGTGHRNQNPGHLGFCVLNRKTTNPENDFQIVATTIFHASTFDFFLVVLGLADSLGSGEPGGSVGGLGALSTSGSGSRGIEGPLETPEKQQIGQGRLQTEMVVRFLNTDTNKTVWGRFCYVVHVSTGNLSPSDSAFYLKNPSVGEKKQSRFHLELFFFLWDILRNLNKVPGRTNVSALDLKPPLCVSSPQCWLAFLLWQIRTKKYKSKRVFFSLHIAVLLWLFNLLL